MAVKSFDYIAEARTICNALEGSLADWKARIDEAISAGSTGTEILMAVRWNLAELLKARPDLPPNLVAKIKDFIMAANKLLT